MSGFLKGMCNCSHTPKHHKRTGRCRGNCKCRAGQYKARWKRRVRR
jgi:hypothetical protein